MVAITTDRNRPTQFHVGLDVHQFRTAVHVLDAQGKCLERKSVRGTPAETAVEVLRWAEKGPTSVCFEASLGYVPLYAVLVRHCRRVVVAHPGQLRMIFRTKRKNDRVDAEKLAKLLYLDQVPEAFVPTEDIRCWRKMIETRSRTVAKRTRVKNGIRAILRGQGKRLPAKVRLWTDTGLAWLRALTLPEAESLDRDLLLDELAFLEGQIQHLTQALDRRARQVPAVELLKSIPGVGTRTAEAVLAYLNPLLHVGKHSISCCPVPNILKNLTV